MGYTAAIIAIVGALATAASTYVSYEGQQYNAAVAKNTADYNAKVQENQAIQSEMESREQLRRQQQANKRFRATQYAAIAKSGIALAGSPLEVLGDTAGQMELDNLDQQRLARQQQAQLRSGAQATLMEGAAQAKGYQLQGYGTILSGASSLASQYGSYKYKAPKT